MAAVVAVCIFENRWSNVLSSIEFDRDRVESMGSNVLSVSIRKDKVFRF
jgi:hypothetical protein